VEIVVDRLVLRGVAPEQADAVAAAIESQLAVMSTQWAAHGGGGLAARDESSRRLPAVDTPAPSPDALGVAVAGAVFQNLTGGRP
jgi:hypothetical protein